MDKSALPTRGRGLQSENSGQPKEDHHWEEKRSALIIASSSYKDPELQKLHSPHEDAASLERLLKDPKRGGFGSVEILRNRPSHILANHIEAFFSDRGRDEVLLLYFSGHGIRDDEGQLRLAALNTTLRLLGSTSVSSTFINDAMRKSRSGRQVLILDCCFGGAFAKGMIAKAPATVETRQYFEGRGRVILTASDAMQYAFEGSRLRGKALPSVFTRALVEGIETGEADYDHDGDITIGEIFEYVRKKLSQSGSRQQPLKYELELTGEIIISRCSTRNSTFLPDDYARIIDSPIPRVRLVAVQCLAEFVTEGGEFAEAALQMLTRLKNDADNVVANYASRALVDPEKIKHDSSPMVAIPGSVSERKPRTVRREPKRVSGSSPALARNAQVFLNLPCSNNFENLFLAYICGVTAFGLIPRTFVEMPATTQRLERIREIIRLCRYSFHDISSPARLNSAFELGMTIGMKEQIRGHHWLVFSTSRNETSRILSDLHGVDVLVHDGTVEGVFRALMNALVNERNQPSIREMISTYRRLRRALPDLLRKAGAVSIFQPRIVAELSLAAAAFTAVQREGAVH